ncbi:MAG TPA: translation initiation factor IF-2 subunit alpha [Candidatus Nanoarchaeia archaeon]|nr:translation initiation factor IF-2 subunit alpha [Candidatus Nanoarchaeia archaeon]
MLYRKQGWPEEGEFVLCTVTSVQYNMVFVRLDEYGGVAVIHISEVSPGRIKNIRDFVKEGKKVVCKVLRVNKERQHVDVSLRRVTDIQRREKLDELKFEQRSEKILEMLAHEYKKPVEQFYKEVTEKIFVHYPNLNSCFEDVVAGVFSLDKSGLDKAVADRLQELILSKIKPPSVNIEGTLKIEIYAPDGVEIVKAGVARAADSDVNVTYKGGGAYRFVVTASDFKKAEELIKDKVNAVKKYIESHHGTAAFSRKEE